MGLESGETIRDRQEFGAYGVQMLEAFLEAKVAEEILSTVNCAGRCRTFRTASGTRSSSRRGRHDDHARSDR